MILSVLILGKFGLGLSALRAVLHRSHRQKCGEIWQNSPLRPTVYHFRTQWEVRYLIWNTVPGNAKGECKHAAGPHNACALFTHSQAGKPTIFAHQKHGCGISPLYFPDLTACAFFLFPNWQHSYKGIISRMYMKFMNNHQQSYMQFQTVSSNSAASSGIHAGSIVLMGGGATLKGTTAMMTTTTKNKSKSILHYHLSMDTSGHAIL